MKNIKTGFTLVELSIVLVIIGLLIGGILVAQSMINTAKITKTVKQLQQINIAIADFQTSYKGLPGDSSAISGAHTDSDDGNLYGGFVSRTEAETFWSDLSTGTGFTRPDGGAYQTLANRTTLPSSSTCLTLAIGRQTNSAGHPCLMPYFNNLLIYEDWITEAATWGPTSDPIKPSDLLALDVKIDDGNATTETASNNVVLRGAQMSTAPVGTCVSGTAYTPSSDTYSCSIVFTFDGLAPGLGIKRF